MTSAELSSSQTGSRAPGQGPDTGLPTQRIFDEIATGVAVAEADGTFIWANPAYCRTVGYSLEELLDLDFVSLTHPEDRAENLALVKSLLAGERDSFVLEKRYVTRSGDHAWVRATVSLVRATAARSTQLVATTEDISAQKTAEARLEQNQALLRIAGRVARVGGWAIDADGSLHWSDEIYALLGYPLGQTPSLEASLGHYAPGSRDEVTEAIERCLADGTPFDLELMAHNVDGEKMWARAVGEPEWGADDEVTRVQGALIDITRRKQAELESQDLAERLTTTLESITDSFYTLDTEWRFTYLNQRAQEVLQRDATSLLGRSLWEELPAVVGSPLDEAYRRAVATGRTVVVDEYYYPPLETYFELNIYPSRQGLAVYFRDVTAQRASRLALKEREAKLEELAELLHKAQDAIIVRDLDHRVTFWNDSAERIFGWTADEAAGERVFELLGLDLEAYHESHRQLLQEGTWFGEVVKKARDGREQVLEARWTLVRDDEGRPESVLQIDTDITERKRLEQQFLRSQRMESIGTLAGGVAHDLNNALLPVVVSAQMLQDEELSSEGRQVLDIIESSAQHGADLVKQLLSFARGVDGRRVPVGLPELVAEVGRISTDTFPKNIEVHTDIPEDVGPVMGDPTQLRQVLVNLCVNARDALDGEGTITITAREEALEVLHSTSNGDPRTGRYVTLTVSDDGPGMSAEVASKIFDPFFTTKSQGEGTGLGLSTSSVIVESHGGFMELDTEPGVGTAFKVHLPVDEQAVEEHVPEAVEAKPGADELILVVDDEQLVLDTTQLVLERLGYRVLLADNGDRAVELVREHHDEVAAVLTDLMMPGMDGAEMTRRIRALQPELPVVAMSGLVTSESAEEAMAAGASRVLLKPFTTETVAAAISETVASSVTS